ncbi:MAG TPA: hypothetical protein VM324_06490 [Egibacteraceae bacterium]|nr:hypothetical protein [Egibacteraceae bacterium]
MPTIRTSCPSCRQQVDVAASRCAMLGGPHGDPVAYAFVCPQCGEPIFRRVDPQAATMLLAAGVSRSGGEGNPLRPTHPENPRSAPPLTGDDLIDFHLLLDRADWFSHLTSPTASGEPE